MKTDHAERRSLNTNTALSPELCKLIACIAVEGEVRLVLTVATAYCEEQG
jgi:hypothetical protein